MSIIIEPIDKSKKLPIGTRRIYGTGQKRYWMKKAASGDWEYDGLVSASEAAAEEKKKKKVKTAEKMKEETSAKIDILEQKADAKQKVDDSKKPSATDLKNLSTKEQLYWGDATSPEARKVCDKTGVLCLDDEAVSYVKKNLDSIFKLDAGQQKSVKEMGATYPLDTAGTWTDDPLFMEDSLANLEAYKKEINSPRGLKNLEKGIRDKYVEYMQQVNHTLVQPSDLDPDRVDVRVDQLKEEVDLWIEAIGQHENDKIVLDKLRSLDKGLLGAKTLERLPGTLTKTLFPNYRISSSGRGFNSYQNTVTKADWDALDPDFKEALKTLGLTDTIMDTERFSIDDLFRMVTLALIPTNETIMKPYFEGGENFYGTHFPGRGNVTNFQYGGSGSRRELDKTDISFLPYDTYKTGAKVLQEKYSAVTKILKNSFECTERKVVTGGTDVDADYFLADLAESPFRHKMTAPRIHTKAEANWRQLGNDLKNAMRSKSIDWATHSESFKAITDSAKILGNVAFENTRQAVEDKINSFHKELSRPTRHVVSLNNVKDNVSRILWNDAELAARGGSRTISAFEYRNNSQVKADEYNKSCIFYSRVTLSKDGAKSNSYGYAEHPGESKMMKSALKAKFYRDMASVKSNSYRSRGTQTHGGASIAYALGTNWQLRKLAKKQKLIPEWSWNDLKPFSGTNKIPMQEVCAESSNKNRHRAGEIKNSAFQEAVETAHKNSNVHMLGMDVAAGSIAKPKVVLRTNTDGAKAWQDKIDKSWTHDNPAVAGQWAKGGLKVHNVFDVMYHDYFPAYKKIEQAQGNVQYGWHGTDFGAGAKIIKGGYRKSSYGLLGQGMYIAKSASKSGAYLGGGANNWHRYKGMRGVLTWNRCAFGKTNDGNSSYTVGMHDSTVNTVYGAGRTGPYQNTQLYHDEWCVKDEKAVIPIQWVDVEIV